MGEADLETDNTVGLGGLEACGSSEKPNLTVLEETRADFPGEKLGSVMSGRRKEEPGWTSIPEQRKLCKDYTRTQGTECSFIWLLGGVWVEDRN